MNTEKDRSTDVYLITYEFLNNRYATFLESGGLRRHALSETFQMYLFNV